VPQQGFQARFAAPKGFERFQRRAAAARYQNGLAVKASGFHHGRAVGCGCFFKGGVGISAQHLGPFVALVTGGVTGCEDVAEGVGHAVECRCAQFSPWRVSVHEYYFLYAGPLG